MNFLYTIYVDAWFQTVYIQICLFSVDEVWINKQEISFSQIHKYTYNL